MRISSAFHPKIDMRPFSSSALIRTSSSFAFGIALVFSCQKSLGAPITKYFTVNPIQVCDDLRTTCAPTPFYQAETYKIFSQAGIAPIFLPTTRIFNSSLLSSASGIRSFGSSGLGRHPNSTTINAWFVNDLIGDTPDSILLGQGFLGGNGLVIDGQGVLARGGLDTFAHEVGHNLGLDHRSSIFGIGRKNLMVAGGNRLIPTRAEDITPDGAKLSTLTASQKSKILSSIFVSKAPNVEFSYNRGQNIKINYIDGDRDVILDRLEFADRDGTTFLSFSPPRMKAGDQFTFFYVAAPQQLEGVFELLEKNVGGFLIRFFFTDGYAVTTEVRDDLRTSTTIPYQPPFFVGSPSGGPPLPPGEFIDDPDPVPVDAESAPGVPGPISLFGLLAVFQKSRQLKKRVVASRLVSDQQSSIS